MQIVIGINQLALEEWIQYRKEKNKPLSNLAITKTVNILKQYNEDHQQHMVDTAIMNDWQGLHPIEEKKPQSTRDMSLSDMLFDTSWADTPINRLN